MRGERKDDINQPGSGVNQEKMNWKMDPGDVAWATIFFDIFTYANKKFYFFPKLVCVGFSLLLVIESEATQLLNPVKNW